MQYMSGEWLLAAPVYEDAVTRDGIYLPAGEWWDYWDGTVSQGPQTVDGYAAPLDKLPLFVREGAIIPMWPDGMQVRLRVRAAAGVQTHAGCAAGSE
jgi:alpha-glucosidase (family GH31 glycosyl hydrolase)